jgi:hypothetical protein
MNTYWEYCWDEYPLGSEWRDKGTGTTYRITGLARSDSLTVVVQFVSKHSARYLPASGVYAEMERV